MSVTGSDASHAPEAPAPGTPPARAMTSSRTAGLAVQELGYRIFDPEVDTVTTESSPELVMLTLWDPLWTLARIDFTTLLLGAVTSVLGFLVHDGVRPQRDTAGLV